MIAYAITTAILVLIAILLGFALNLQWGTAGLVNFGIAGFFALGAYTTGLTALAGAGTVLSIFAAVIVCAISCGAMAAISARLSDEYLAILTLGFSEIVGLVALSEDELTGGSLGLAGIPRPLDGVLMPEYYESAFLCLLLAVVIGVYLALNRILRSPFGRALRTVREDEVVAETLGKNVLSLRIRAFALGGAIIGVAGAFHAFYLTYIDPTQFAATITGYTFMAVIFGGRGSNRGLIVGAALIMTMLESTRFLKDAIGFLNATQLASLRLILVGLGLVLLLIYRPQGFFREYRLKGSAFFTPQSSPQEPSRKEPQ
ncbi:MAG TPA: branched-chain amino acid ABC transporter permease [Hyphomicrobiales bacterium]|nr:branched-chain amino acid ABC transporter permease [Hyphomicrobiales bacterium]